MPGSVEHQLGVSAGDVLEDECLDLHVFGLAGASGRECPSQGENLRHTQAGRSMSSDLLGERRALPTDALQGGLDVGP